MKSLRSAAVHYNLIWQWRDESGIVIDHENIGLNIGANPIIQGCLDLEVSTWDCVVWSYAECGCSKGEVSWNG